MPNPQVCMFCHYRRTPVQGVAAPPCKHTLEETAPAATPADQPRPGLLAAARRQGTQGGLARHN